MATTHLSYSLEIYPNGYKTAQNEILYFEFSNYEQTLKFATNYSKTHNIPLDVEYFIAIPFES